MELVDKIKQFGSKNIHKNKVHKILAYSYFLFFIFFFNRSLSGFYLSS